MAYDEDLADRIRELLVGEAGLTEKKMFGGLASLIDAQAVGGSAVPPPCHKRNRKGRNPVHSRDVEKAL